MEWKMTTKHARISKEMAEAISYIRIEHLKRGKIPPSSREITKRMMKNIKKENLCYGEFIKL